MKIEQKGMTWNHDFGYSFPLFSSLLKKRGKKKRRIISKNCDCNSCLSARSSMKLPFAHCSRLIILINWINYICTIFVVVIFVQKRFYTRGTLTSISKYSPIGKNLNPLSWLAESLEVRKGLIIWVV